MHDSTIVVVRMRPRAIPLAMITMRKSTHRFPFLSYTSMGLRLAAPFNGPPELHYKLITLSFLINFNMSVDIVCRPGYKRLIEGDVRGPRKPQNRTEIRQKTANRLRFFPEYGNRTHVLFASLSVATSIDDFSCHCRALNQSNENTRL